MISNGLIDSHINHDEFVSVNSVLREYNEMKEEIKNAMIKTMETYCASCKKNTANKNSNARRTKQNRLMLPFICAVCGKKKMRFINNQEPSRLEISILV